MREPIPRVDVSPILGGDFDSRAGRSVLEQMRAACEEIGFLTIEGHGVPLALLDAVAEAGRRFFELPADTKLEAAPRPWNRESPNRYRGYFPSSVNGKEGLDIADPALGAEMGELLERPYYELNRFPPGLDAEWCACVSRYFAAMFELGELLLRGLATSIGGDPDRLAAGLARPRSLTTLRFNYYPRLAAPVEVSRQDGVALSCETHVDSSLLTLLYQDQQGRLQVRDREAHWHDVPFDREGLVVNTGLALQALTGGAFVATHHRVLFSSTPRLSIPFFIEPAYDFELDPSSLDLPCSVGSEPLAYEKFLERSLRKFSEYERSL